MTLYIKNMVSLRCKIMVRKELRKLRIGFTAVELGHIEVDELSNELQAELQANLERIGLSLIKDSKTVLAERVKNLVNSQWEDSDLPKLTYSHFLSQSLQVGYPYLSKVFHDLTGMTIEKYIILQRIERVKELVQCHEISLTEIAYRLHYSSVAHLSRQFKEVTGFCVTTYKSLGCQGRQGREEIGEAGFMPLKGNSNQQFIVS